MKKFPGSLFPFWLLIWLLNLSPSHAQIIPFAFFKTHSAPTPPPPDPLPVASHHYKLDEISGTTAKDSVGNLNGTLINGATWKPGAGVIDGAINLTGSMHYVEIPDSDEWTLSAGKKFAYAAWVKWDANPSDYNCVISTPSSLYNFETLGTANNIQLNWWANSTNYTSPAQNIELGKWYHVALSIELGATNGSHWYLNGVDLGSFTAANVSANPTALSIGGSWTDVDWDGDIDDVRIFANTLTAEEVEALYQAGVANHEPYPENVVLLIQPDADDSTIVDYSPALHTVTTNGNAALSTGVADPWGGSRKVIALDGTGDYLSVADSDDWYFTGDFTVEAWVYFTALSGSKQMGIVGQHINSTDRWHLTVSNQTNDGLEFDYRPPTIEAKVGSDMTTPLNEWVHLAVARSGSDFLVFNNGTLVASATNASSFSNFSTTLLIGAFDGSGSEITGYMTGIRITNGAARYTANFEPSTSPYPTNQLIEDGLVVRYFLDEASTGQTPTKVWDSGPQPRVPLDITYDNFSGTDLTYTSVATGKGWDLSDTNSIGLAQADNNETTKIYQMLSGTKTVTYEVVADVDSCNSSKTRFMWLGQGSQDGQLVVGCDTRFLTYLNDDLETYALDLSSVNRSVYHIVVDTNLASNQVSYYRNGTLLGNGAYTQNTTLTINSGDNFVLGNRESGNRSMEGQLYYAALYNVALTPAEVAHNATVLLANDDGPDLIPNTFDFTDVTGATVDTEYTDSATVTGFLDPTRVSVVSGTAEIRKNNDGSWVTSDLLLYEGDTLNIRMTSASSQGTTVSSTIAVGFTQIDWQILTTYVSGLNDTGLVARYYFSEAASGTTPSTLTDYSSSPLHLPITYDGANLTYTSTTGGRGWDSLNTGHQANARIAVNGTKYQTSIEGGKTFTLEAVMDMQGCSTSDTRIMWIGEGTEPGSLAMNCTEVGGAGRLSAIINDTEFYDATENLYSLGRNVYHIVIDTNDATNNIRYYRNGSLLSNSTVAQNTTISMVPANDYFYITNRVGGTRTFDGQLYYFALYNVAKTPAQLVADAAVLLASDDVPGFTPTADHFYNLDEVTGTAFNDSVGSIDGILTNGPTWWDQGGVFGGALNLDGTDDIAILNIGTGNNEFETVPLSWSFWFQLDATPFAYSENFIFLRTVHDVSPWGGIFIQADEYTGRLDFEVLDATETQFSIQADDNLEAGRWYHVVATLDAAYNMQLYVDGELQADTDNSGSVFMTNYDDFYIGASNPSAFQPTDGRMDDIRFYSSVLNQNEITNLYQAGLAALSDTLIHRWTLDETAGTTAADSVGSADGVMGGGLAGTDTVAGAVGTALAFNGTTDKIDIAHDSSFDFGGGDFSVSLWLKANYTLAAGQYFRLFEKDTTTPSDHGFYMSPSWENYDDFPNCVFNNSGTRYSVESAGLSIRDNQWHNITCVKTSYNIKIYVDGVLRATNSVAVGDIDNTANISIGYSREYDDNFFPGSLDDVRIYRKALSEKEVAEIFALGQTPVGSGSVTFNGSDEDMRRTPGSASDRQKFTLSTWIKRNAITSAQESIFSANGNIIFLGFNNDILIWDDGLSEAIFISNEVIADLDWHHLVIAVDTTLTSPDNVHGYLDGVEVTYNISYDNRSSWEGSYDTQFNTTNAHWIGSSSFGEFMSAKLSEFHWIDGQQLTPQHFAYSNGGVWTPKDYTGSYGTNGFYLFGDGFASGDIGNDQSGNNNDFTTLTNMDSSNYSTDHPPATPTPGIGSIKLNGVDENLDATFAGAGDQKTWTFSTWVKRNNPSGDEEIFGTSNMSLGFENANRLSVYDSDEVTSDILASTDAYVDENWHHIMMVLDTTAGTADERLTLYVDGNELTSFATNNRSQYTANEDKDINNNVTHYVGSRGSSFYFQGLLTFTYFIDGQALTPAAFGYNNGGVWTPKSYGGTFGTTGFQLFGESLSATDLGADESGNNNDFNLTNVDSTNFNSLYPPTGSAACPTGIVKQGGVKVAGACWYAGDFGESCTDVCGNVDLSYSTATLSYAGSGASDNQNCWSVLDALGFALGSTDINTTANVRGCQVNASDQRRRGTTATTAGSSNGSWRRACACE